MNDVLHRFTYAAQYVMFLVGPANTLSLSRHWQQIQNTPVLLTDHSLVERCWMCRGWDGKTAVAVQVLPLGRFFHTEPDTVSKHLAPTE